MILYLTSPRATLRDRGSLTNCPLVQCKAEGFTEPHLCFATEPLVGLGEYVYEVDIPQAQVTAYEYKNTFRPEKDARYFAIPLTLLDPLEMRQETYETLTGRPWNKWVVTVLDRRGVEPGSRRKGKWAIVWQSRDGIASARVSQKVEQEGRDLFLSVEIKTTSDFDPETDYIVIEDHEEQAQSWTQERVKETWRLQGLAGVCPQWMIYPTIWKDWASDRRVQESAVTYILDNVPASHRQDVAADVAFAQRRGEKEIKARAWRNVADRIARIFDFEFGMLPAHSWTAVNAMPMRIARKMATHLPYAPWDPPKPQPEYADPNASGRKALANLYGPFPKHGPGVDHAPQDRPFIGREGELGKVPESFEFGQRRAAAALAG